MYKLAEKLGYVAVLLALAVMFAAPAALADSSANSIKNCPDGDWCAYNRSHSGWRHSPLTQINSGNVNQLRPAWIFQPGTVPMGLISTPLAVDGMVYLPVNPSTVWKLDGATGKRLWAYVPEMAASLPWMKIPARSSGTSNWWIPKRTPLASAAGGRL